MSIRTLVEKILKSLAIAQDRVSARVVPPVLGLIGLYYVTKVFGSLKSDTTAVTNAAFVVMGSLAALAFGWARSLPRGDDREWRVRYGGEQLFKGALQVLTASLLKYAALDGGASERFARATSFALRARNDGAVLASLDTIIALLVVLIFSSAVVSAAVGFVALSVASQEPMNVPRDNGSGV